MGRAPIHAGVGVHFGAVVAGVLGNRDRLEFTVIGDTVNVANRIEEHSATRGLSIVVSEDALAAAGELASNVWRFLGDLPVRGRRRSVRVYGLARELNAVDMRSQ
jgi:adenylate cyclase